MAPRTPIAPAQDPGLSADPGTTTEQTGTDQVANDPAPADAPAPAPRPTTKVRVLRNGPIGAIGTERDDLPTDWVAEAITRGDVETIN